MSELLNTPPRKIEERVETQPSPEDALPNGQSIKVQGDTCEMGVHLIRVVVVVDGKSELWECVSCNGKFRMAVSK